MSFEPADVLFLTEEDVRQLIDMPASVEVVEEAFRQLASGNAKNNPRNRSSAPGIFLHSMSASAEYLGYVGWKNYTTTKHGARFHVSVYNIETGLMTALMQADYLGQLRTGAASGVATKFMARENAKTVGLFGTGLQARTQLQAICDVRDIEYVEVYGRNEDRRQQFAAELAGLCGIEVVAADSAKQTASNKDIICTATTSKQPVFDGDDIAPGTHLNIIGGNFLFKTEIDVTTVKRSQRIVCDSIEQAKFEGGDFVESMEQGILNWDDLGELYDVVAGNQAGRESNDEITLFKSLGLAIEDVAMAARIIDRARQQGIGNTIPL